MKKNTTIRIKNELPELLEAVCYHDDCPEWLRDAIWDAFNGQEMCISFSASWWRVQFESLVHKPTNQESENTNSNVVKFGGVQCEKI